jgi:hypothetical protein
MNKRSLLIALLCLSFSAHAKLPLCISLGRACGPALNLRDLKMRTEAYPFDWTVAPFESLYAALDHDFKDFLADIKIRQDNKGIIDGYGFHFIHDLPTITHHNINPLTHDFNSNDILALGWEESLPLMREKYRRRIERLKNVCTGTQKVFFIRHEGTKQEAILLKELLKNKWPALNFVLVAISNKVDFQEPWHIDHIKNFSTSYWHNPIEWAKIFKQVGPEFDDLVVPIRSEFESYSKCHDCYNN